MKELRWNLFSSDYLHLPFGLEKTSLFVDWVLELNMSTTDGKNHALNYGYGLCNLISFLHGMMMKQNIYFYLGLIMKVF